MNFLVVSWTKSTIHIEFSEFKGAQVVIGTYNADTEEQAKQLASAKTEIDISRLEAIQIA